VSAADEDGADGRSHLAGMEDADDGSGHDEAPYVMLQRVRTKGGR
jgi:hypothetical protein